MTHLTIPGELTDLNAFIKATNSHFYAGNKVKRGETERVVRAVQGGERVEQYPVIIRYSWYSKNARKDIDNVAFAKKFINDGLVEAGVLENDSRRFVAGFSDLFFIDKENPRVEVLIEPVQ